MSDDFAYEEMVKKRELRWKRQDRLFLVKMVLKFIVLVLCVVKVFVILSSGKPQ